MKKTIIFPIFFLILSLLTVELVPVLASPELTPTWMKPSAYAEYNSAAYGLNFLNGSTSYEMGLTGNQVIFRWTCLELNGTTAKLKVCLNFGATNLSNIIYVDTTNRSVFLSNGTLIGTTRLWLPANPIQGQEVIFWNLSPEQVLGTVDKGTNDAPDFFNTIQGVQKGFFVNANGTMMGQKYFSPPLSYDLDTGVVLIGFLLLEPMLLALNVKEVMGGAQLVATNINLGPREISFDIRAALPFIAVIIAVIIIFATVYIRLRKRKH